MTSPAAATDYTNAYQDTSDWCHPCAHDKPPLDRPSSTSPSGVQVLRVGTAWKCPACSARWLVARIEDIGVRWITFDVYVALPDTSA